MSGATLFREDRAIQGPVLYLRTLVELAHEMGFDARPWMLEAGVDPSLLSQPTVALSNDRYASLVSLIVSRTNEPALGLLLGRRLRINAHGSLAFALMNSASLRQAITLLEQFFPLRTSLISVRLIEVSNAPQLVFTPAPDLGSSGLTILEATMLAVRNVFEYLSPGARAVESVQFAAPSPRYSSLAGELFVCPVVYDAKVCSLKLHAGVLSQALSTADAQTLENARSMCQRELDSLSGPETLTARVQRSLLSTPGAMLSLEAAARLLHVSPRTLHRRLEGEGTHYRTLVDQVRHQLALQHLKHSTITLQEIAHRLGYSDQANFRRAFKRWQGVAPQVMRQKLTSQLMD